jgi:hypothetical protein
MPTRLGVIFGLVIATVSILGAADRHWQTGTWRETDVRRKMLDFGPGSTSFDGHQTSAPPAPTMRAMADVRTYVIETDDSRIELEDVVPIGRRSVDVTVGAAVTFAIEKNAVYVRDSDGKEYRLRVTKKTARPRDETH